VDARLAGCWEEIHRIESRMGSDRKQLHRSAELIERSLGFTQPIATPADARRELA